MRGFKKRPYSSRYKTIIFLAVFSFLATALTAYYEIYPLSVITFISGCVYINIARKLPIRNKFKQI